MREAGSVTAPGFTVAPETTVNPAQNPEFVASVRPTGLVGTEGVLVTGNTATSEVQSLPTQISLSTVENAATVESIATTGTLVLQARGISWVEVTDANGILQLRKTMGFGEKIYVGGALPLSVVLGRSDRVLVTVRGQAFDLTSVAKDNVARFEVK